MDVGIIGGADGPTTVYISSDPSSFVIAAVVLIFIAVAVIAILKIRKRKRKAD